jgi:hypothetical protein
LNIVALQAIKISYLLINLKGKNIMSIEDRLMEFVEFLEEESMRQLTRDKLSVEDSVSACTYAYAYAKDKNAILAIINGKRYFEDYMD